MFVISKTTLVINIYRTIISPSEPKARQIFGGEPGRADLVRRRRPHDHHRESDRRPFGNEKRELDFNIYVSLGSTATLFNWRYCKETILILVNYY